MSHLKIFTNSIIVKQIAQHSLSEGSISYINDHYKCDRFVKHLETSDVNTKQITKYVNLEKLTVITKAPDLCAILIKVPTIKSLYFKDTKRLPPHIQFFSHLDYINVCDVIIFDRKQNLIKLDESIDIPFQRQQYVHYAYNILDQLEKDIELEIKVSEFSLYANRLALYLQDEKFESIKINVTNLRDDAFMMLMNIITKSAKNDNLEFIKTDLQAAKYSIYSSLVKCFQIERNEEMFEEVSKRYNEHPYKKDICRYLRLTNIKERLYNFKGKTYIDSLFDL